MNWENKLDVALINKHRRENTEVPSNVLRRAKADRQRLIRSNKRYFKKLIASQIVNFELVSKIEEICEESSSVESVKDFLTKFKTHYMDLLDTAEEELSGLEIPGSLK